MQKDLIIDCYGVWVLLAKRAKDDDNFKQAHLVDDCINEYDYAEYMIGH